MCCMQSQVARGKRLISLVETLVWSGRLKLSDHFVQAWYIPCQTWNTAYLLYKQILLYTAPFEHFQCNMREHFRILHQICQIYTSIACTLAHYSTSVQPVESAYSRFTELEMDYCVVR